MIKNLLSITAAFGLIFSVAVTGCSQDEDSTSFAVTAEQTDYEADGDMEMKVSIRALEQFGIIETVLDAVKQTGYDKAEVINQGTYAAMISFKDGDSNGKSLEKWVVKSKMIIENGVDVNKVQAWIEEDDGLTKAEFKIISAPTDTNTFGIWSMNVGFFNAAGVQGGYFIASSSLSADGNVEVTIAEENEHDGDIYSMAGKLILSNDEGSGAVRYPDWESCMSHDCTPELATVSYAFNENEVIVQKDSETAQLFNRNTYTDIYMDYNIYTAAGENIRKSLSFGMPLKHTDATSGDTDYYYYGGWQGRHQLWGPENNASLAVGEELQSGEYGEETTTYTLAAKYMGYLVEKTLIAALLDSIKGEVIETWMNDDFRLKYVTDHWEKCSDWECSASSTYDDISGLESDDQARKRVYVWDEIGNDELTLNDAKDGFDGYTPNNGDTLWINISQPIFISYDGTSWIQYNDVTYDGWEPTINENNTSAYTFDTNGEFYMHSTGLNYILRVTDDGGTLTLKKELENVIQPGAEALALHAAEFEDNGVTYTFDWNSTNETIQLLDDNDEPVTQSIWYMLKTGGAANTSYAWQYAENENETWNIMTYLQDTAGEWVFLDDPVFFGSTAGVNGNGDAVTIGSLAYDGHLFGLPDVWRMLQENDWTITEDMKGKIINVPPGDITGKDGTAYKIRPRYGSRLLNTATASDASPTIDSSISLDDLPVYVDPVMGDLPEIDVITVVEGELVTTAAK